MLMFCISFNVLSQNEENTLDFKLYMEEIDSSFNKFNVVWIITNIGKTEILINNCLKINETSSNANKIRFMFEINGKSGNLIESNVVLHEKSENCYTTLLSGQSITGKINLSWLYNNIFDYSNLSIYAIINLMVKPNNGELMKLKSNLIHINR